MSVYSISVISEIQPEYLLSFLIRMCGHLQYIFFLQVMPTEVNRLHRCNKGGTQLCRPVSIFVPYNLPSGTPQLILPHGVI
jgi:hypothetical protein